MTHTLVDLKICFLSDLALFDKVTYRFTALKNTGSFLSSRRL